MLNSSLQKIFPNEEVCSNVLKSIHLDHSVKKEILKSKKNKKDKPTIIDIIGNSAYPEIVCPKCSHNEVYKLKNPKYPFKCSRCEIKFNERTNTIFQGGQLPLQKYYIAMFLLGITKKVTAVELSNMMDVSEKTAYELLRKLRFLDQVNSKTDDETRIVGCKRFKLPFDSKEKLVYNKALLETINDFLEKYENLSSLKTVLKEEDVSFMSYVGSKKTLLLNLLSRLPKKFNNYYEPFIGGGSLFFALNMLINAGIGFNSVDDNLSRQMYISDYNKKLISLYNKVKVDFDVLIEELNSYKEEYSGIVDEGRKKDYFECIKHMCNNSENVSSLVFLVNTCYKGVFDFTKEGEILANYGNKAFSFDEQRIKRCSNILKQNNIHIANQKYEKILDTVKAGDFVYLDPPYYSCKNNAIDYGTGLTSREGQKQIRNFLKELHNKGVFFMTSNHICPTIRELYSDTSIFNMETVYVTRGVSKKKTREAEVLIRNYS